LPDKQAISSSQVIFAKPALLPNESLRAYRYHWFLQKMMPYYCCFLVTEIVWLGS
jgi:hypothetical protein